MKQECSHVVGFNKVLEVLATENGHKGKRSNYLSLEMTYPIQQSTQQKPLRTDKPFQQNIKIEYNTEKSVVFIHINNEEIRKIILFTILQKYLEINITKDLYNEKFQTQKKGIVEDTKR